jgi:uncharacterized membrane protein (UPF0127 family)
VTEEDLGTLPPRITIRQLWWGIAAILAAGLFFFMLRGADQPKDPSLLPTGVTTPPPSKVTTPAGRVPLSGFGETEISVHLPSGEVLHWCVMLASTQTQQERGLMGVTDATLGGYDGMLFRFPSAQSSAFYMKNTPMPLSIAFIGATGGLVSSTDMAPCLKTDQCELYRAAAPYVTALEVPQGGLARLGIAPESQLIDEQQPCTN